MFRFSTSRVLLASVLIGMGLTACVSDLESSPPANSDAVQGLAEEVDTKPASGERTKVAVDGDGRADDLEQEEIAEAEPAPTPEVVARKTAKRKAKPRRGRVAAGLAMVEKKDARPLALAPAADSPNTEGYDHLPENDFIAVADDPRSTFSVDVDTASYSNVRRFLNDGVMPPTDAVRIEELVNYFDYDYAAPVGPTPFSMTSEVSSCPWNDDNLLVHVGLQGKVIDQSEVPARNLVFLLDVSGSMNNPDKLPLLKRAMGLLVDNLRPEDKVSIVVYAGASGVVLEPTAGDQKTAILGALDRLRAGGSTNGGAGIELAYKLARRNFIQGGINRVMLATDGDFNVGVTSRGDLMRLIERQREGGVFLSVFGFGRGNVQDSTMEQIADKGNGNYAYIDSVNEARKVLVEQAGATLVTIAKDVKLQVEFNPSQIASYRLIGYENRKLAHTDFNDDRKDAGEIGAGHSVTALYEIVPRTTKSAPRSTDALKYQAGKGLTKAAASGELLNVKIRYKAPSGAKSKLLSFAVTGDDRTLAHTSNDFRFAAAVAEFGLLLRNSRHRGEASYDQAHDLAKAAIRSDQRGRRAEFLAMVRQAKRLSQRRG